MKSKKALFLILKNVRIQAALMKNKNIFTIITALVFLAAGLFAADVKTVQYTSKKITNLNNQTIQTESKIFLDGVNVKIQFLIPEKRILMLVSDNVYVIEQQDNKKDVQQYALNEVPVVVKQMLVPSIFSAADFMRNLKTGFNVKPSGNIFVAVPKNPKNISRIEYSHDKKTDHLNYYRMFGRDGGLISETKYSDYKTFDGQFILPTKIQTIINGKDGLIDDTEIFTRIKVNQAVNKIEFEF